MLNRREWHWVGTAQLSGVLALEEKEDSRNKKKEAAGHERKKKASV